MQQPFLCPYPILISLIFFIPDIFPQQEKGKRCNADVRQAQQHQPFAGRKHACQNTENKCHARKSRYVLPTFAALYRSNNICQYPKEQSNCPREYRKAPYSKKIQSSVCSYYPPLQCHTLKKSHSISEIASEILWLKFFKSYYSSKIT